MDRDPQSRPGWNRPPQRNPLASPRLAVALAVVAIGLVAAVVLISGFLPGRGDAELRGRLPVATNGGAERRIADGVAVRVPGHEPDIRPAHPDPAADVHELHGRSG